MEPKKSRRLYQMIVLMTLAAPHAARAIGLGEIHVDSALNEPLNAYIDIVGASRDDLADLRAAIADRETFQHFGADRPAFLLSSRFKVQLDAEGRPVLQVRSSQAFTDPVVSLLVDLRWPHGELVREYSLLLDPAGLHAGMGREPAANTLPAAPAAATAAAESVASAPVAPAMPAALPPVQTEAAVASRRNRAAASPPTPPRESRPSVESPPAAAALTQYKVKARDTLRMIARSTGARSETKIKRVMIAVFRANPAAFEGNINRLHRDVVLNLPTAQEVDAISAAEAKREVHDHMAAWRAGTAVAVATHPAPVQTPQQPAAAALTAAPAPVPGSPAAAATADTAEALNKRVQALEQELESLNGLLRSQNAMLQEMQQKVGEAKQLAAVPAAVAPADEAAAAPAVSDGSLPAAVVDTVEAKHGLRWGWIGSAIGLLILAIGANRLWRRRKTLTPPVRPIHPYDIEEAHRASEEHRRSPAREFPNSVPTDGIIVTTESAVHEQDPPAEAPVRTVTASPAPEPVAEPQAGDATVEETILLNIGDVTARLEAQAAAESDDTAILDVDTSSTSASTARIVAVEAPKASSDTVRIGGDTVRTTADTVRVGGDTVRIGGDTARRLKKKQDLDFTMVDLNDQAGMDPGLDESTAQHVQMPSMLNQHAVTGERRTNIVDVLKSAIARDPARGDLQLKLLELYFGNATNNRTAFLEVAHHFAQNPQAVDPETWNKIMAMGRQIAPENPLFADESVEDTAISETAAHDRDDLANCA